MNRLATFVSAVALLSGTAAAYAADLPSFKDTATGSFPWGGAYVSVAAGEGFSRADVSGDAVYSTTGFIGRATAGYDMPVGQNWSAGIYAETGSKDIGASGSPQQNFTYGGGGKVSYHTNGWQLYTKVGYEGTHYAGAGFNTDLNGIAIAPGAELALTNSLALMIEPRVTFNDPVTAGGWKVTNTDLSVVGGLTWHFGK